MPRVPFLTASVADNIRVNGALTLFVGLLALAFARLGVLLHAAIVFRLKRRTVLKFDRTEAPRRVGFVTRADFAVAVAPRAIGASGHVVGAFTIPHPRGGVLVALPTGASCTSDAVDRFSR